MSAAISDATKRPYGVERVCRVWEVPRSTVYSKRARAAAPPKPVKRRGPRNVSTKMRQLVDTVARLSGT